MNLRMEELAVVVMKWDNDHGAKGWQIKRAEEENNDCTQQDRMTRNTKLDGIERRANINFGLSSDSSESSSVNPNPHCVSRARCGSEEGGS